MRTRSKLLALTLLMYLFGIVLGMFASLLFGIWVAILGELVMLSTSLVVIVSIKLDRWGRKS